MTIFKHLKHQSWILKNIIFLFLLFLSRYCFAHQQYANLLEKINAIETTSGSVVGVPALKIETNEEVSYNATMPFFMASTNKLPTVLTLLNQVDEKKDSLERIVNLDLRNSVPGSGDLYSKLEKGPIKMSLRQLLNLMLMDSDNSASDIIFHEINGSPSVMERMHALGFNHIFVNRSFLEIYLDSHGANRVLLKEAHSVAFWEEIFNKVPVVQQTLAWQLFENDLRDTATPQDMRNLLVKLYKGKLLAQSSTNFLINIMIQCKTGKNSIKGLLPANTPVAHKTGTWTIYSKDFLKYPASKKLYRFASDVGIITLPHNKGHIAMAIYVKSNAVDDQERYKVIALVARAVYDYFDFH